MSAVKNNDASSRGRWRRRAAELFVVFAGVMAAFLLNEWASSRKDAERAEQYIQGMLTDLGADSVQLAELVGDCSVSTQTLLRFLFTPDHVTIPQDSLNEYLRLMARSQSFRPRTVTFDALTFSGDMSIITDLGIRKDLVEHYDQYKEAHEIDQVTARYWETIQIPFLLDQVDMRTKKFVGPADYRSHQFKNILMGHVSLLQQKTEIYRRSLNGVDSLRSRLSAFAEGF